MRDGKEYFQPAKVVLLASYTYENSRLLLLSKSKAYPERPREQSRPGGQALLRPLGRGGPVTRAVSVRPQHLVRSPRRAYDGRRIGPTTTSTTPASASSAAPAFSVNTEMHPIDAAAMRHFRHARRSGDRSGRRSCGENAGALDFGLCADQHVPLRRHVPGSRSGSEGSAGRSGLPHHQRPARRTKPRAGALRARQKMEEWFRAAGAIEVHRRRRPDGPGVYHARLRRTRMGDNPETNVVDGGASRTKRRIWAFWARR